MKYALLKSAVLFAAVFSPLQAELLAHFQTSKGNVDVALQYDKAPQAVANFITLAQGTRSHLNPSTGAISNTPYYVGEKFFRVINDLSFKIAQTGSGTGTNSGGPGFSFKDEFSDTLAHVPYVLSMANSGPNTNGSQIFFTGNATIPSLDYVHTIFGLITDATSRSVIDAILAAGNDGTSITAISFSRTDALAIAFDENAQNLPTLSRPDGGLTVNRGVAATWNFGQAMSTGAIFRAFRSTTLATGSWSELSTARQHVGIAAPTSIPSISSASLDTATAPSAFYNLTVARHPGAVSPSTLANRTVAIDLGGAVIYYNHNSQGSGGAATYTSSGGSFNFTFNSYNFQSGAHDIQFVVENVNTNPNYLLIKIGCDTADDIQIDGRHSTQYYDSIYGWQPFSSGFMAISR